MYDKKQINTLKSSQPGVPRYASCLKVAQYACASVCAWASVNLTSDSIQARLLNSTADNFVGIYPLGVHISHGAFEEGALLTLLLSGIAAIEIKRIRDRSDRGNSESGSSQSGDEPPMHPAFDPQKCLDPYFDIKQE